MRSVTTFIPLTGLPGAGKTTPMLAVASLLRERGRRVAVITNDKVGAIRLLAERHQADTVIAASYLLPGEG